MAKRLTDNINSLYFEAANKMTSKKARRKIVAYVESYDDVFFWRSVLGKYEDETRYFEILLPTRNNHLDRGKKAAIGNMLKGVGKDMIAWCGCRLRFSAAGYYRGFAADAGESLYLPYLRLCH